MKKLDNLNLQKLITQIGNTKDPQIIDYMGERLSDFIGPHTKDNQSKIKIFLDLGINPIKVYKLFTYLYNKETEGHETEISPDDLEYLTNNEGWYWVLDYAFDHWSGSTILKIINYIRGHIELNLTPYFKEMEDLDILDTYIKDIVRGDNCKNLQSLIKNILHLHRRQPQFSEQLLDKILKDGIKTGSYNFVKKIYS